MSTTPRMMRLLLSCLLATSSVAKRRVAVRTAAELWSVQQVAAAASGSGGGCPCTDQSLCQPITSSKPVMEREIYGFGGGDGSSIDFSRVTTVAWASDPKLMCAAHAAGRRVVMAAPQPEKVFTDNATARAEWVSGTVAAIVNNYMDGIVFDWESPCEPGADSQRQYSMLIGETRDALHALAPSYQISTCVAWSPDGIDGRNYDIPAFAAASDLLYVMDYDTRSQVVDACVAAANAPYFGMEYGLKRFLGLGVSPQQLILGVPWYGYRYKCLDGTAPAAHTCPIALVPFRGVNCSDAAGSEVALEGILMKQKNSTTGRLWDAYQGAAFFNSVENGSVVQYWYDDVKSLAPKYAHAKSLGLLGVGPFTFTDTKDQTMYDAFDAFLKDDYKLEL